MRRRLIQLGLFMLAGAIVNIAVAWGCLVGRDSRLTWDEHTEPGCADTSAWRTNVPGNWPDLAFVNSGHAAGVALQSFGATTFVEDTADRNQIRVRVGSKFVKPKYVDDERDFNLVLLEAGWPVHAFTGASLSSRCGRAEWSEVAFNAILTDEPIEVAGVRFGRLLPTRPIWPGFAFNTLFYAAILWILFAAPFTLRRRRRIKRGLCPACAYPVGESDVCTECGKALPGLRSRKLSGR